MRISPGMFVILQQDEGLRLEQYKDTEGHWTIGYGHKLLPGENYGKISRWTARQLLAIDVKEAEHLLAKKYPWVLDLDPIRYGIIVNMTFNLGITGLSGFRNFLKAACEQRYKDASEHMLKSKWAKQVKDRAKRLARYMEKGEIC